MIEKRFYSEDKFYLEAGGVLERFELRYHVSSDSHIGKRVVWICHALTANSNPEEWWSDLVGEGKLFDTKRDFVICCNMLGSPYGSTSPLSTNPNNDIHYMLDFPLITVRDLVKSMNMLRESLGIESIDTLVGGSIGGFQALEWAISSNSVIKNLVLIATNSRVSAWGAAFNESQRMALMADECFSLQLSPEAGRKGLEAARSIALLSYRSFSGYRSEERRGGKECLD